MVINRCSHAAKQQMHLEAHCDDQPHLALNGMNMREIKKIDVVLYQHNETTPRHFLFCGYLYRKIAYDHISK